MWPTISAILIRIVTNATFDGLLVATIVVVLRQHLTGKALARLNFVTDCADKVFGIVEDMKAKGQLPAAADKAEVGAKVFSDLLAQKNVTATDAEIALAKAGWSAAHGEAKAAAAAAPVTNVTVAPPATAGVAGFAK